MFDSTNVDLKDLKTLDFVDKERLLVLMVLAENVTWSYKGSSRPFFPFQKGIPFKLRIQISIKVTRGPYLNNCN